MLNLNSSAAALIVLDGINEFLLWSGADHTEIVKAIYAKIACLEFLAANDKVFYAADDSRSWAAKLSTYKTQVGV
jgi:hypothetical protein